MICGLTLRHTRGHLYRAVLEAGGEAKRLVAVGGGTKGGLWTTSHPLSARPTLTALPMPLLLPVTQATSP